jgi:hypothetical protein
MKYLFTIMLLTLATSSYANEDQEQAMKRLQQINNLAKHSLSCSKQTDCIAIPAGTTPCGGPGTYFITSRRNLKLEELLLNVNNFTVNSVRESQDSDLMSICTVLEAPNVTCESKQCVVVEDSNSVGF